MYTVLIFKDMKTKRGSRKIDAVFWRLSIKFQICFVRRNLSSTIFVKNSEIEEENIFLVNILKTW